MFWVCNTLQQKKQNKANIFNSHIDGHCTIAMESTDKSEISLEQQQQYHWNITTAKIFNQFIHHLYRKSAVHNNNNCFTTLCPGQPG